jgi:hypothetical protein
MGTSSGGRVMSTETDHLISVARCIEVGAELPTDIGRTLSDIEVIRAQRSACDGMTVEAELVELDYTTRNGCVGASTHVTIGVTAETSPIIEHRARDGHYGSLYGHIG